MRHATPESKYQNKLIEPRQQHEDDFGYIIGIQKLYNINIWVYTPCGGGKVELFKPVDDFDKDRKLSEYWFGEMEYWLSEYWLSEHWFGEYRTLCSK